MCLTTIIKETKSIKLERNQISVNQRYNKLFTQEFKKEASSEYRVNSWPQKEGERAAKIDRGLYPHQKTAWQGGMGGLQQACTVKPNTKKVNNKLKYEKPKILKECKSCSLQDSFKISIVIIEQKKYRN